MVIDTQKSHMYNLARESARRRFIFSFEEAQNDIHSWLNEENGLEERIRAGKFQLKEGNYLYSYNEQNIYEYSFADFCRSFLSAINLLESADNQTPFLRKSIPEFEKLVNKKTFDKSIIRRAYYILHEEILEDEKMSNVEYMKIFLDALKDCSETNHASPDRIFIDKTHLFSKIWKGNEFAFSPIPYYITPFTSDGMLIDPTSLKFKEQLKEYSEK